MYTNHVVNSINMIGLNTNEIVLIFRQALGMRSTYVICLKCVTNKGRELGRLFGNSFNWPLKVLLNLTPT